MLTKTYRNTEDRVFY